MKITLQFGALTDPPSKQLAGYIFKEDGERLDRDHDAINRCHIFGYMPAHIIDRARNKLLKRCVQCVRKFEQEKAKTAA